jgi:hypothetical protein
MSQITGFDTNKEKNYEQLFRKTTTATMLADVCADGCGLSASEETARW